VGIPGTFHKTTVIKNATSQGLETLDYSIETPWVKASRTCQMNQNSKEIIIEETLMILKRYIRPEDTKTLVYQEFQRNREFYRSAALIFDKPRKETHRKK